MWFLVTGEIGKGLREVNLVFVESFVRNEMEIEKVNVLKNNKLILFIWKGFKLMFEK
jgi:hypothetical protein